MLDFKGQSADSNESKSGQIKLQRLFKDVNRDSFVKGTRLRTVPPNTDVFCKGYDHGENVDLSKSYLDLKRKM